MPIFESNHYYDNEAWIVFQLNDVPVMTEADGDFYIVGLMDAASGYMLGTEFVSVAEPEISQFQVKHILKHGYSQSQQYPSQLIIHDKVKTSFFAKEAEFRRMKLVHAATKELWPIIGEAVTGLQQHMGRGPVD